MVDRLGLADGGWVAPHLSTTCVAVCHLLLDADNIPAVAALAIRDDTELTAAEHTAAMFWRNCCNDKFKSSLRFYGDIIQHLQW